MDRMMEIAINGKPRSVAEDATVADVLAQFGLHERMVVVELSGEIVRRERFADTRIAPGATLEIVQMMAGG